MKRVFLDANVYFAGCFSKTGASALILELAQRRKLTIVAGRLVLREAERNLRKKISPKTVKEFHQFLKNTELHVVPPVRDEILTQYDFIHPKDAPVLAVAISAEVDFLITLDRKHFMAPQVMKQVEKMKVKMMTPAEFLHQLSLPPE